LALLFFLVSLIAGFFGFSGVSAATAGIAKVMFYIAISIFVVLLIIAVFTGQMVF